MLQATFIFLKGIGENTERLLWEEGIDSWDAFLTSPTLPRIALARKEFYDQELIEAKKHYQDRNTRFFAQILKPRDHWRLYDQFRHRAAYVDIETTGEPLPYGEITLVGIYGNGKMTTLIQGENLSATRLQEELSSFDVLVTFFGSGFDLPFLKGTYPQLVLDQPHIDLCFAARRLGFKGGLKAIEQTLGCERSTDIEGLTGWDAVRLWNEWQGGNRSSKDTLIEYNAADCQNLEPLADLLFDQLVERYGPPKLRLTSP